MQGIVSTRVESGRSPQSFKLGLCLPAPHSSFPVVPWGQPRVVSGSEDPPRLQMLPSELPLHHCVAAPDTAFVLEDALTRTHWFYGHGGGTQTSREPLWPGCGDRWQRGQVAAPSVVL